MKEELQPILSFNRQVKFGYERGRREGGKITCRNFPNMVRLFVHVAISLGCVICGAQAAGEDSMSTEQVSSPPLSGVKSACRGDNLEPSANLIMGLLSGPKMCEGEERVENGDYVDVQFIAHRYDSCEVLDMTARGEQYQFQMGRMEVIEGWEQGLKGACKGQTRRLTVPSDLGYGDDGINADDGDFVVPGGATLVYTIEIVDVEKGDLPVPGVDNDPDVQEKLKKLASKPGFRVRSPRTSKHREKNLKTTNHHLSRKGLEEKRRKVAERKERQELRARRMGGKDGEM